MCLQMLHTHIYVLKHVYTRGSKLKSGIFYIHDFTLIHNK